MLLIKYLNIFNKLKRMKFYNNNNKINNNKNMLKF